MRSQPNISQTKTNPGILPIYIGKEMCLTETYLPPRIGRGAPVDVVDIEPHPMEPPIQGRDSIASYGCVILRYMPKHIYVRVKNCDLFFLVSKTAASQPGVADLKGVNAVSAQPRTWRYHRAPALPPARRGAPSSTPTATSTSSSRSRTPRTTKP